MLYDAWGNQRAATGATVPNYRFTGAELDTASGLYHMGARFYDPTIGRWLSEDPVQDLYFQPETLNFYAYAFNGPVDYIDPDGETPIEACLPCIRIWVFVLAQVVQARLLVPIIVNRILGRMLEEKVAQGLRAAGEFFQRQVYKLTPFGPRVLDFLTRTGIAIETKYGAAKLTTEIRLQAQKDAWLLAQGFVNRVVWYISQESDQTLIDYLRSLGIQVVLY